MYIATVTLCMYSVQPHDVQMVAFDCCTNPVYRVISNYCTNAPLHLQLQVISVPVYKQEAPKCPIKTYNALMSLIRSKRML